MNQAKQSPIPPWRKQPLKFLNAPASRQPLPSLPEANSDGTPPCLSLLDLVETADRLAGFKPRSRQEVYSAQPTSNPEGQATA